jgi:hypothetical protein
MPASSFITSILSEATTGRANGAENSKKAPGSMTLSGA